MLPLDITTSILNSLPDRDKIQYLSIRRHYNSYKDKIIYYEAVSISKIKYLWYFDCFENIILDECIKIYNIANPWYHCKFIDVSIVNKTMVNVMIPMNMSMGDFKKIQLPKNIKKLCVLKSDNVQNFIPTTVTHLTIDFDQDIRNCIPKNVTHLTLGIHFNKDITNCIPKKVTHLTFGGWF